MRVLMAVLIAVGLAGCITVDVHRHEDKSVNATSPEETYSDQSGDANR